MKREYVSMREALALRAVPKVRDLTDGELLAMSTVIFLQTPTASMGQRGAMQNRIVNGQTFAQHRRFRDACADGTYLLLEKWEQMGLVVT